MGFFAKMDAEKFAPTIIAVKKILLCALAFCLCMAISSCRFSETITETVYSQDAEITDYDNETKLLINSTEADETTDEMPQLEITEDADETAQFVLEVPVYGGDQEGTPVPQTYYDPSSTNEAQAETENMQDDPETTDEEEQGDVDENTSSNGANSETGDGDNENEESEGTNPDNEGDELTDSGAGKNANNEIKVYDGSGEFAEIPQDIQHVTAVGEAAVLVAMLGGSEGALVAADAEFTQDSQVQKVLANKGISDVATMWSGDGTEDGSLVDVDALIELDPDLCYVVSGDNTFTEEQEQILLDNNILVYYLPDLKSAGSICSAVSIIGQTLETGGNASAGELYRQYIQDHDALVEEISTANGGIAGGYDYDTNQTVDTAATSRYALYISDWDYSAIYTDPNGFLASSYGVGVTNLGSAWSPLAYYMSVGGVVNNASAGSFRYKDGYTSMVWQFSQTLVPASYANWQTYDSSKINYNMTGGNGLDESLTWCSEGRIEATGGTTGYGLGTEYFPAVIVKTQAMKTALENDMQMSNGLYHPYSSVSSSSGGSVTISVVGFYSGSNLCEASIGLLGGTAQSVLNDGINISYYDVYVNPCGLFESWTDGSAESFLETAWIYQQFIDPSYDVDSLVIDFYQTYFDYTLTASDLDAIYQGA